MPKTSRYTWVLCALGLVGSSWLPPVSGLRALPHRLELSGHHCLAPGAVPPWCPAFPPGVSCPHCSPGSTPNGGAGPGPGSPRRAAVTQQPASWPSCHRQGPLVPCWHRLVCKAMCPPLPVQLCLWVHTMQGQASPFWAAEGTIRSLRVFVLESVGHTGIRGLCTPNHSPWALARSVQDNTW